MIKEDLLYYVWKTKQFYLPGLKTTDGRAVRIAEFGMQNRFSGPDFSQGEVYIDDVRWVGNVEMHIKSSDWLLHKHQHDPAYQNVILHVVYEHDRDITFSEEQDIDIPTIAIGDLIDPTVLTNYQELMEKTHWVPCEGLLDQDLLQKLDLNVDRVLVDRLENKMQAVQHQLVTSHQDWEAVLLSFIARYMGGPSNAEPMQRLVDTISHDIFHKNSDSVLSVESLLYGTAGLLTGDNDDPYIKEMREEYSFLARKYNLTPFRRDSWKFSGGRPAGFPTIRISQLAHLLVRQRGLFSAIKSANSIEDVYEVLSANTNPYWDTHYTFGTESKHQPKPITATLKDRLIINAIVPVLFAHGNATGDQVLKDKVTDWLYDMKVESNAIVKKWKEIGVELESAAHSQSYLQLKTKYCDLKRCLDCPVGNSVVMRRRNEDLAR